MSATAETVLVVEDEAPVRAFCCAVLRRSGYRVLDADGPAAALDTIAQAAEPVDLVLTDVTMPGMNGTEMVKRISQPGVKVLYMSGYSQHFLEPGVQLLQKPFSSADLLERVRATLDSN